METPATPEARLEAAIRDRAEARRLASARARLDASLTEARNEVFRRKGEVAREQADVDKLERPSLSRVLAGLSGSLADKAVRERAEVDAARYALGEAEMRHRQLESEADVLDAALAALGPTEATYEGALADVIALADAGHSTAVTADARRRTALIQRRREIDEALAAGEEALPHLDAAAKRFKDANVYSAWDVLLGGGMISSALKHAEIDDAAEHLAAARTAVERFSRELADVDLPGLAVPAISRFDRGMDVWVDFFVTDFKVAGHVADARRAIDDTITAVRETLDRLRAERADLADR